MAWSVFAVFTKPRRRLPTWINTAPAVAFDPLAGKAKGLVKQVDLLYKLVARCTQLSQEQSILPFPMGEGCGEGSLDRRIAGKRLKQLQEARRQAVEQLKLAAYFCLHHLVSTQQGVET